MTNAEAIEHLKNIKIYSFQDGYTDEAREALDMAIKAMEAQEAKTQLSAEGTTSDLISRAEAIDAICNACSMVEDYHKCDGYPETSTWCDELVALRALPSAQPEWNNHTVACLLAELFDDTCACNYNGIDEWLPSKCELLDSCPNPVGVACWEQYLKHRAERRTDETDYRKE